MTCPLCERLRDGSPIIAGEHASAIPDGFPVGPGHTLIVAHRHEADLFGLPAEEQADMWALVRSVQARLRDELRPQGFTVGANVGAAGGQTIPHAHIHVIPRFTGDVVDPRGGVRWVIPARAAYW